ncbi:MAG: NADH-quinone oxidoreductase subunit M, partial [Pseudomonadota bacterium]|nr:NADH-quinone oxidoreductase subunit M [Pseudomonadota bacterium]
MIIDWPILSALVFTPAIGALFVLMIRGEEALVARNARWVALWTTLVTFGLALLAHAAFDSNISGFQLEETKSWLPTAGINYHLGVDGISLPFLLLTAFLMPICVLIGWQQIQTRVREYMIAFLLLESMLLGLFCALDLILFYLFFESVLIPMFLIIGIWGGAHRVHAAYKFFLFTLAGALPMLLAVIVLYQTGGTGDIGKLMNLDLARNLQIWLFLGFLASFAIKLPMWPFHTWLPDAHTEAPTTGSIMLAGVLLKMGGYGFLRLSLPILPDACAMFAPTMFALAGIAVVYTSLVALAQHDLKKMIAYSSVAHMGFVVLGIFSLTVEGIAGALMQMISHGLVVTALFIAIGLLYERR